jgi:translation initiation factor 6 (eIF-6)
MLVWTLLLAPVQAGFVQQGHKLVGTGAVGNAQQGCVIGRQIMRSARSRL